MVRCGKCGVENAPDAKYCKNCSSELDGGIQQGSSGGTQTGKYEDSDETGTQVWGGDEELEEVVEEETEEALFEEEAEEEEELFGEEEKDEIDSNNGFLGAFLYGIFAAGIPAGLIGITVVGDPTAADASEGAGGMFCGVFILVELICAFICGYIGYKW